MISFQTGDILSSRVDALVNTVNCVGVMGKGIALQFKEAFPENFRQYAAACAREEVQPGRMFVHETRSVVGPRFIINFPTKRHWRGNSRIEDIQAGLDALVHEIRERKITSIAIPPLGAGLGGLDWQEVKPRIRAALSKVPDVNAIVYEPFATAQPAARRSTAPSMSKGRAALVELVHRYLDGLLDPFVTLLEVHKLMYFMQVAGEPLRLRYNAGPYGPYAENLRHVLRAVEGYMVNGFKDDGDIPTSQLTLVPGAITDAQAFLSSHHDSKDRFERVAELVSGFESSFGLELLATVHWIISNDKPTSLRELIARTYGWNDRKKQFTPRQIELAASTLAAKGWAPALE